MKGLFFIAGEKETAKSEIVEKAVELLKAQGKNVVVFKPVGDEDGALFSVSTAKHMIVEGQKDSFIEQVIGAYKALEKTADFVLVEGTNLTTRDTVIEFRLNAIMASNLCLPAVLVMKEGDDTLEASDFTTRILKQQYIDVLGMLTSEKDLDYVLNEAACFESNKVLPKMFEYMLVEKAKSDKQRIVLPEGESERVLKAAAVLNAREIADIILLGNPEEVNARAKEYGISLEGVTVINPLTSPNFTDYANTFYELRKAKGVTLDEAVETMKDSAYFGTMMVYKGDADGMVSGAEHTTAHTIRPALQFIKTKPTASMVSGAFLMCFNGKLYVFADCAVTPNPTPEQLSEIAISTAETATIFGLDPKVAFLSYGSGNSGKGPSVDAVKEAVRLTKEKAPDLVVDGPIQFDAAIDAGVAKTKMPDSPVAGQANVFIFPDLNTGNCCYKAVQRASSDCLAAGPILQGLKKPVNDLSRGCTVPDIINTVAFTALFAQN